MKSNRSVVRWALGVLLLLIFLLFILPNLFNTKEREAFSTEIRITTAKEKYHVDKIADSVQVAAGDFYERSAFHTSIFGEKYRKLWRQPVKVKVLRFTTSKGGLTGEKVGGGMQTIGIDAISEEGRTYDLRSVNKDQSKALPEWLQYSYARPMFRDQVAALNPYASLVLPTLADAVGIMHTNPELVFVPFDPSMREEYATEMAGRLAILEENPNGTWTKTARFNNALEIMGTEDMFERAKNDNIGIDTLLYLKSRLFDILISDWDRHEGQWEWALVESGSDFLFQPIPKDRDMAFYRFNEGYLSFLALKINPKFQSFTPDFENVSGLTVNSRELDQKLLPGSLNSEDFIKMAEELQEKLTDALIKEAFLRYPPEIYALVGEEHIEILKSRRDKLGEAAEDFFEALRE